MDKTFQDLLEEHLTDQDFIFISDQEKWSLTFPPKKYMEYRPQPSEEPEEFPCMIKLGDIEDRDNCDIQHVCIVYL